MANKAVYDIIYGLLSTDTTVNNGVKNNIFPNMAPQGTKGSYIVYHIANSRRDNAIGGSAVYYKIGIGVYSRGYKVSNTLIEAVKNRLDRWSGPVNSVYVTSIHYQEEGDELVDGPELHHRQAMFVVCMMQ